MATLSKVDLSEIRLIHPVDGPVTQRFGERSSGDPDFYAQWGYPGHNGQDFGVNEGTPVRAAAEGDIDKVAFENGGYGRYIRLKHTGGLFYTYYAHLSETLARVGLHVPQGGTIGLSGNTGASTGPHLHFELRIPSAPVSGYKSGTRNPEPFFIAQTKATGSTSSSGEMDGVKVFIEAALGANVRIAPNGLIVGVAPFGTEFTIADEMEGEWQPVICYVHKTLIVRPE